MTIKDFIQTRAEGAEKIAREARLKGGVSNLTAIHFESKLPVYGQFLESPSVDGSIYKQVHEYWSKVADKLKNTWTSMSDFQKLTGQLEAYGEIAHFIENPKISEKEDEKKPSTSDAPKPPSSLNPIAVHQYYMDMSDYHDRHASKHKKIGGQQQLWSDTRAYHDDRHQFHKAMRDGYAQKALSVELEKKEESTGSGLGRLGESYGPDSRGIEPAYASDYADEGNKHYAAIDKLAGRPPKGVDSKVWNHVVRHGHHTDYGAARAHYNNHVKKYGMTALESIQEIATPEMKAVLGVHGYRHQDSDHESGNDLYVHPRFGSSVYVGDDNRWQFMRDGKKAAFGRDPLSLYNHVKKVHWNDKTVGGPPMLKTEDFGGISPTGALKTATDNKPSSPPVLRQQVVKNKSAPQKVDSAVEALAAGANINLVVDSLFR